MHLRCYRSVVRMHASPLINSSVRNLVKYLYSIRSAWQQRQHLSIHGWIYNPQNGFLDEVIQINDITTADG